jgi:hypothetical protein
MVKRVCLAFVLLLSSAPAYSGDEIELTFKSHLQRNMVEQHVYVEREVDTGRVYRVTPVDQHRYLDSPAYATEKFVPNAPLTHSAVGPHKRGKSLGFSLGDWLAATGTASYRCSDDAAKVKASFEKLVPNGVYTIWYTMAPRPPLDPFEVLVMPLGPRDGSKSTFWTDAKGHAEFSASFSPCLQMSGKQVNTFLAIAWHSNGETYGSSPGQFSTVTHDQIFTEPFPIEGR